MPMHDVTVERFANGRATVLSPSCHDGDEELFIHMRTPEGLRSHAASVVSNAPVSYGGALCFRLELRVSECGADARKDGDDEPR